MWVCPRADPRSCLLAVGFPSQSAEGLLPSGERRRAPRGRPPCTPALGKVSSGGSRCSGPICSSCKWPQRSWSGAGTCLRILGGVGVGDGGRSDPSHLPFHWQWPSLQRQLCAGAAGCLLTGRAGAEARPTSSVSTCLGHAGAQIQWDGRNKRGQVRSFLFVPHAVGSPWVLRFHLGPGKVRV